MAALHRICGGRARQIGTTTTLAVLLACSFAGRTLAQGAPVAADVPEHRLALASHFSGTDKPVDANVIWRVFRARARADGSHALVATSKDARPVLTMPDGHYIVHLAYGLASAIRNVDFTNGDQTLTLSLKAGALELHCTMGGNVIAPANLAISVYAATPTNPQARLVLDHAAPDRLIGLPEGNYHVVSTYLDTSGSGGQGQKGVPTNSVVSADLVVKSGKLTTATLPHQAATITLKLVNVAGGGGLANTTFAILTPGGDVIREVIGAFPKLVLAAGTYDAIARNNGKTYESTIKVDAGIDRDVEILAQKGK
ncbi:MAG: hypothetical protein KGQ37_12480 [Hyphomicrobiales bacterium]|nr:hypothetical protein [Hyphomicrobiales bacterium]